MRDVVCVFWGTIATLALGWSSASAVEADATKAASRSEVGVAQPAQPAASATRHSPIHDERSRPRPGNHQPRATDQGQPSKQVRPVASSRSTGAAGIAQVGKTVEKTKDGIGATLDAVELGALGTKVPIDKDQLSVAKNVNKWASRAAGTVAVAAGVVGAYQREGVTGAAIAGADEAIDRLAKAAIEQAGGLIAGPPGKLVGKVSAELGTAIRDNTPPGRMVQELEYEALKAIAPGADCQLFGACSKSSFQTPKRPGSGTVLRPSREDALTADLANWRAELERKRMAEEQHRRRLQEEAALAAREERERERQHALAREAEREARIRDTEERRARLEARKERRRDREESSAAQTTAPADGAGWDSGSGSGSSDGRSTREIRSKCTKPTGCVAK